MAAPHPVAHPASVATLVAHARQEPALEALLRREIADRGVAETAAIAWARGAAEGEGMRVAWGEIAPGGQCGPLVFDLASVTKPLTATVIVKAIAERRLSWTTRVADVLTELEGTPAADASIDELLAHRAGLPAWGVLYRDDPWALASPSSVPPLGPLVLSDMLARAASRRGAAGGEIYSDIGYVLLGEMAARATGRPLALGWAELGCADARTRLAVEPSVIERMPPTERIDWRGEVRGEVHDENAAMLERAGGSPGHAGAFGTALDVVGFAARFLGSLNEGPGESLLPAALAQAMIEPLAGGTHSRGWDLRSGASPSSGRHFGPRTFGHLGFTGTSVWIDPDASAVAVLLTNRTWPTRDNVGIRGARPRVHDALWEIEP